MTTSSLCEKNIAPEPKARVIIQAAMISLSEFRQSVIRSRRTMPQSLRPWKPLVYNWDASLYFVCLLSSKVDLFRSKINCKGGNVPRTRDSKPRKVEARTQEKQQKTWMLFAVSRSKNIKVCGAVIFGHFSFFVTDFIYTSNSFVLKWSLVWLWTVESYYALRNLRNVYYKVQLTKGAF